MRRTRRCAGFFVPEKRRNEAAQTRPYMGKRAADPLPAFGVGSRDYDQFPKFPRPHAFTAPMSHALYTRDIYAASQHALPPKKFLAKNPQKLSTVATLHLDHAGGLVQTSVSQ